MSINNSEDVNNFYLKINELIDDYIDKWKISPSKLKVYLKPGSDRMNKFILRNNLSEIKGIKTIINDVIEDRVAMEKDKVVKFENFRINESIDLDKINIKEYLYKGIDKADINMEKAIADYYDANLSNIDIVDSDKHIFRVSAWSNDIKFVVIYTEEDFNIIKENLKDYISDYLMEFEVKISDKISINLENVLDKEKINTENLLINDKICLGIITDMLSGYKYQNKIGKFYIWEKEN